MEAWILIARSAVTSMLNIDGGTADPEVARRRSAKAEAEPLPPVEVAATRVNERLGACRDAIGAEAGAVVDPAALLRAAEQTLELCAAVTASADTAYTVELFDEIATGLACFEVVNRFRIAFARRAKDVDPSDAKAVALRASVEQAVATDPTGQNLAQLERFSRMWSKRHDGIAMHIFEWEDLYHDQVEMEEAADQKEDGNTDTAASASAAWALAPASAVGEFLGSKKSNPKTADGMFAEHLALNVDKKAKMRGRVVNKHARWNVCFGEANQEPDYEGGKGRVVAFVDVPLLNSIRETVLPKLLGDKAVLLQGELNHYYDNRQSGIGFHGDSERKMVACLRLGAATPLHYQWFHGGLPVGERVQLTLRHGDFYVMSEKATGFDWKKRKIPTLRHAAGAEKFLKIIKKKPKAPGKPDSP